MNQTFTKKNKNRKEKYLKRIFADNSSSCIRRVSAIKFSHKGIVFRGNHLPSENKEKYV